jgi:hypothetical protein
LPGHHPKNLGATGARAAYGTQFVVQTSSDLTTWADVLVGDLATKTDGPGGFLIYTLTGSAPRFVRLKVTPD